MVSVDFPYIAVVGKGTAGLEARDVLMNSVNFFFLLLACECQGSKVGLLW